MNQDKNIQETAALLRECDAILITASNGLSISEGYHIFADNDDFKTYFGDFRSKYGVDCLIRGVFTPMTEEDRERYMQTVHRYMIEDYSGSDVMQDLKKLVEAKPYMIVTSNADTHFQMNGFDPMRIFEVEGNFDGMAEGSAEWRAQQERFQEFVEKYQGKRVVLFELGIGSRNRLIKAPTMDLVARFPEWTFVTLNMPHEINIPAAIEDRSIALPGYITDTFRQLLEA